MFLGEALEYRIWCPPSNGLAPVYPNGGFVYTYGEQDIVVVNLHAQELFSTPEREVPPGVEFWWAPAAFGRIDPRPLRMGETQETFDRIQMHGGIFIVFTAEPEGAIYQWGAANKWGNVEQPDFQVRTNWHFLTRLSELQVQPRLGNEIMPADLALTSPFEPLSALHRLVSKHLADAYYSCILHPTNLAADCWMTLATNKFDEPVAGVLVPRLAGEGFILLVPQIADKQQFLGDLLSDVLPGLVPRLFPHIEKFGWISQQEYELPAIIRVQRRIGEVIEQATQSIAALHEEIQEERLAHGFLQALLTETGEALVQAVKQTLELLGFTQVVDVDAEMRAQGLSGPKREDLRIEDEPAMLLVEVKGISGIPKEAAALQVEKYVFARIRERQRPDIRGLAVVNHERHLPPFTRQNEQPFSADVVVNAEELGFGLLTTWDLFRLARNYLSCGWTPEVVKPLFQRNGRILPIPAHYMPVGTVTKFYPQVQAVEIDLVGEVRAGDRIAFEGPVEFLEQEIASLQVNRQPVESAQGGRAGVQVAFTKEQMRAGIRVYRVATPPSVLLPAPDATGSG